ncbi:MAG: hemerythrin domain-containing protein [Burkholderiales bacterium]
MERVRHNIYAIIHKALRLAMAETLPAVGRLDTTDAREVSEAIVRVRDLVRFCKLHLDAENTFIHPAIEARRPGGSARIAAEHVEHLAAIAAIERDVEALARAPLASRDAAAFALYSELGKFVGENFVHMHVEETVHNAALWEAYTDEEILAIENAIKAHHTPEEMAFVLRWMLPAMTPAERAGMFTGLRKVAPPPVVEKMVALAKAHVDAGAFDKLTLALAA